MGPLQKLEGVDSNVATYRIKKTKINVLNLTISIAERSQYCGPKYRLEYKKTNEENWNRCKKYEIPLIHVEAFLKEHEIRVVDLNFQNEETNPEGYVVGKLILSA